MAYNTDNALLFQQEPDINQVAKETQYYREGISAFKTGKDKENNPYKSTIPHTQWNRGWCSAEWDYEND